MAQVEIDNLSYPYTTVVYLEVTFPNGMVSVGSGVMVGPNDVLTASHMVYDPTRGGAASSVKVTPGYDPSPLEQPYGSVFGSFTNYYTSFDPNNDGLILTGNGGAGLAGSELDFALVSLNVALGDRTGWMGIDPNFASGNVNVTGYPGFYNNNPMNDFGFVARDPIDYFIGIGGLEIHPGNSGGPVWYSSSGSPYVVGVVSTGIAAAELSGDNFNTLIGWMNGNDYLIANIDRILNGTAGADVLTSGGGNDTLNGLGGNDTLSSGAGNDTLNGGPGNDILYGDAGNDTLNGDDGNDALNGGSGINTLNGGAGDDTLYAFEAGTHTLNGGDGNDNYFALVAPAAIIDSSGSDTLWVGYNGALSDGSPIDIVRILDGYAGYYFAGNSGSNLIYGNAASNVLWGAGGSDTIFGGAGNDTIYGDAGPGTDALDVLYGEDGDDTILGGGGNDVIYGGSGGDTIVAETGNDLVYGDDGNDAIDGRAGNDQLFGGAGSDVIFGDGLASTLGFGSDTIHGDLGDDTICGEDTNKNAPGALDVLYGDDGNDTIYGGAGDDLIYGGNGADVIDGGAGNDFIVGGPGPDIMLGSGVSAYGPATAGGDLFSYSNLADGGDQIYGFDMNTATGRDGLDISSLLDGLGYFGNTPRAAGYLYVFQNGTNTDVYVDANGPTGGANLSLLVTLVNITAAGLTDSFFLF